MLLEQDSAGHGSGGVRTNNMLNDGQGEFKSSSRATTGDELPIDNDALLLVLVEAVHLGLEGRV